MVQLTESVVDILRRCGPGVLPARKLRRELLRSRPARTLGPVKLRRLVAQSGDRLRLLEVALDPLDNQRGLVLVDSWVVLMDPEDAPDRSDLALAVWQTLSAMAGEIDMASRVQVCRWAIKVEEARRLTAP